MLWNIRIATAESFSSVVMSSNEPSSGSARARRIVLWRRGLDEISDVQIIVRSQHVRSTLYVIDIQPLMFACRNWHGRS